MNINPFKNSNPMTWQDAAKVSVVLTAGALFTQFFLPIGFVDITDEPFVVCFNLVKFAGSTFFTNFIALAGLAGLTHAKEEAEDEPADED